jgi:hypothetical protein
MILCHFFQPVLDSRYIATGRIQQKTPFPNISSIAIEVRLSRHCTEMAILILLHACSFPRELFTEKLPSNKSLRWFRYFGFQASRSCDIYSG